MAGLRDLQAAPNVLAEVAPSDWTAEDAARIGASPFQRGLRSAGIADQAGARMQAALEAAARGDKAEAIQLRMEAEELAGRSATYAPPVASYKDVTDATSARDYLTGVAGQGVRSTLPSLVGGIAAAAGARFGLRASPRMTSAAGAVGSLIPAYGMEKREAVMNAASDPTIMNTHTPQEILNTATVKGGVNAGLEAAFPAVVAGRTANIARKGLRPPTLGRAATGLAGDMAIEGGTELAQEKVGQLAQGSLNPQRDTSSDVDNMIDAAISGAVTAPILGGHSHALDAAKAISAQVRARAAGVDTSGAAPATDSIALEPGAPVDLQPQSYPLDDNATPPPPGPLGMFADRKETVLDRGRAEWLLRKNEGAAMPPEVRAAGRDAIMNWLGQQDQERFNYVQDHFKSVLDDPNASEERKTQAADLLEQFKTDPKGTYSRAATMIATEDKARRATEAVKGFAQPAQDFIAGLSGKEIPKRNAQYDATDRALYSVFHQNLPQSLQGDKEAVLATDMIRRFARGQLPPSMAVKTAHLMVQTYGDQAVQIAEEAANILRQGGVNDEAAAQLPKIIKGMVGDEESRIGLMTKGLNPLVTNDAREQFKQAMGREFTTRDIGLVADHLDKAVTSDTPHEGLKALFGSNYEKAINVARAVHDARHKAVSNFNKLLEGPTTDETVTPADESLDEEGNAAHADFEARSAEKAVEKSAPTVYSFADGDRTSASKGFGKPYDSKTEATKIAARKEKLAKVYPGALVTEVPAAQVAKNIGFDPNHVADTYGNLEGKVVLQVSRPTNEDPLSFDRETTKKLLRARTIERDPQPGDSTRDKRYSVQMNKAGKEFIKVTNPGVDEGAMYVALNKADGTPLVNSEGKREYAMVTTDDLIAEMRKRDFREGVTSSTDEGPARDLKLLSAGLTSLITSADAKIDRSAGITFISPDGKRSTVALSPEGKASLPDNLKVGKTTVGEIRRFGSLNTQDIKNDVLEEFTTLGKDEVKAALRKLTVESLETKKVGLPESSIVKLVAQYGFPENPRNNLTAEQKQALTEDNWGELVDSIKGTTGPKRELYDYFYTNKGYSKLTERARAIREILPQLERRAELIAKGETLDPTTGLPIKNDTDNVVLSRQEHGESPLLVEEKTIDEASGYFARTQATREGVSTTQEELDRGAAKSNIPPTTALPGRNRAKNRPVPPFRTTAKEPTEHVGSAKNVITDESAARAADQAAVEKAKEKQGFTGVIHIISAPAHTVSALKNAKVSRDLFKNDKSTAGALVASIMKSDNPVIRDMATAMNVLLESSGGKDIPVSVVDTVKEAIDQDPRMFANTGDMTDMVRETMLAADLGGLYVPEEDRIVLVSKHLNAHIVLHEIMHAMSFHALGREVSFIGASELSNFAKTGTSAEVKALSFLLDAVRKRVIKTAKTAEKRVRYDNGFAEDGSKAKEVLNKANETGVFYGMTNLHEFISETFSNPRFQKLLATTKLSNEDAAMLQKLLGGEEPKTFFDAVILAIYTAVKNVVNQLSGKNDALSFSTQAIASLVAKNAAIDKEARANGGLSSDRLAISTAEKKADLKEQREHIKKMVKQQKELLEKFKAAQAAEFDNDVSDGNDALRMDAPSKNIEDIDENDIPFNTQKFDDRPLTDAEKAEITKYAERVLGSKIKVAFEETLGHSGEWDQTENTIKIAMMAGVNGMSVAQHEALHAFFTFLARNSHADMIGTLQAAAGSPIVRRQLERLLANEPAALRQLADPEERAAYMYQFWVAAKAGAVDFRIGPETEGFFNKIAAFFRKAMGILSAEEKADRILQAFHDGQMKTPSAVAIVAQAQRSSEKMVGLRRMIGEPLKAAQQFVQPAYDYMAGSNNSEITKIADLFYRDTVSTEGGQGFINARSQQGAVWLNKFSTIVEGVSEEDLIAARDVLQGRTAHVPNATVARVVNLTRQLLRQEFFPYMKDAQVNVVFRRNYFPRVWDMQKIIADASGFREKLLQHHRQDLEKLGDIAFKDAMSQYEFDVSNDRLATKPEARNYTAEATADHIVATLSQQNGVVPDDTDPTKAPLGEGKGNRPGFTPFMQAVNKRTLNFLDMKVFGEYQKDDFINIMSTYLLHGVRRAEYARRFGNDGEKLASMMDAALTLERSIVASEQGAKGRNFGANLTDDPKVFEEVDKRRARYTKAIMALEGTLGYDITPTQRRINSGLMVYQNLRILPLALFSSLIDPLGITIRSGNLKDAFDAFQLGMRELTKNFTKGTKTEDEAAKMAELLGTVDNKYMLDALGETYNSIYLYGWAKKLNEKLFQFNGMESWNRAMRIAATQVAIKFIGRHAQGENADHSERWLAELGLKASDVKFNDDGTVKTIKEEGLTDAQASQMRIAIQRFVDSAVLRPSAAQRPAWASDPHYALFFHLKQFTYSFQQVILRRAWHEWKHGNLQPAMILMSYVPLMLAADIAKGFLQGGGEEPDWKKGWTVGDYTANAVQRAGLLGVGQFAVDAKHSGITSLGGPTVDQVARAFTDSPKETAVRALPGNPLYRDMVLSNDDYRS